MREHTPFDHIIEIADQALKVVAGPISATREMPGRIEGLQEETLSQAEKSYSARLMRINHAGEVAAQGLYHGQAVTARKKKTAEHMRQNAHEESDHLAWCEQRLEQLGGHTSLLAPLWYAGSFMIGAAAGLAGDRWSFGFVKETENQVIKHLDSHLVKTPANDKTTLAIIEKIKQDEDEHANTAEQAGARELPKPIKLLMQTTAKMMTTTAYYL